MERPKTHLLWYATLAHFYTLVAVFVHPFNGICAVGVVNMSLPLSDQPVFGEWFVFVEVQGYTYNKSFEVQKYGRLRDKADFGQRRRSQCQLSRLVSCSDAQV